MSDKPTQKTPTPPASTSKPQAPAKPAIQPRMVINNSAGKPPKKT